MTPTDALQVRCHEPTKRGWTFRNNRFTKFLVLLLLLISSPCPADQPLTLAVHPYLAHHEVIQRFEPLAGYLAQQLNTTVKVQVGQNYAQHIEAIGKNRVDIAYLGPASYVRMQQDYGLKPLLGRLEVNGEPTFHGHIVIHNDSRFESLQDLSGRSFAFGDPNSTMSNLVPGAMLKEAGIDLKALSLFRHFSSHKNVALAVLAGDFDAGAVKQEVFEAYRGRGLRSLARTPKISEHLLVTRSDLPSKTVLVIRNALLSITFNPDLVARLLKPIKATASGIAPVKDADYDTLRRMIASLEPKAE